MMSACVKWAKEQVEVFNTILERQLSSTEQGGKVWTECMNQAKDHAKMLSEVGLDFKSLVGRNLDNSQRPISSVGLGLS
jgi:exocyst complex component 8